MRPSRGSGRLAEVNPRDHTFVEGNWQHLPNSTTNNELVMLVNEAAEDLEHCRLRQAATSNRKNTPKSES